MNNELIISASPAGVDIALLQDKQMVELNREMVDSQFAVGDIYLGKVKKIIPGLNAAFVDVGHEKDAFLHYLDLGPRIRSMIKYTRGVTSGNPVDTLLNNFVIEPEIEKAGKINQVLSSNLWLPVQIAKEPISTKGPRISSEISIAGRYIVLVPFGDTVSISQKISSSEERTRLKRLLQSIKPKNFGIIIRTVAEGKKVAELDADLQDLLGRWKACTDQMRTAKPPQKLLGEIDRTSSILRDMLNDNFSNIYVNDTAICEEVKQYIRTIAPGKEEIVKLHKGKASIFEHFGVDRQIKSLFGRTVTMPGGAYLIIEHTEALHVIDVNSGGRVKSDQSQQQNALDVNLESAREIARQLRLRDMGGIIVIDFIDMQSVINRKALYDALKQEMKKDRAKHTILPPSKFGLVELTRQRVRPENNISVVEKCPACAGTGEIKPSMLIIDEIENNLHFLINEQNEKTLVLQAHPFITAYLTQGIFSIARKWMVKYKRIIKVKPVNSYHFLEYHFVNAADEEIKLG